MSATPADGAPNAGAPAMHTGTHTAEAQKYIDALTLLYTGNKEQQDKVIDAHMADDVTFDDNLMIVHKRPSMKVQFHAIAKMLHDVKFEARESDFKDTEDGKRVLHILNHQEYGVWGKLLKFEVDTKLWLNPAGLVTRHEDRWRDSHENFTVLKRVMGATTSSLMKLFRV